jgi:hypothetical protein
VADVTLSAKEKQQKPLRMPHLTPSQVQEKHDIEHLLPLCALIVFHHLASNKYHEEVRRDRASRASAAIEGQQTASSWISSWWSGTSPATNTTATATSTFTGNKQPFSKKVTKKESTKDLLLPSSVSSSSLSVDIHLNTNAASISLTSYSHPVATLDIACTSMLTLRPDGDITLSLSMTCLSIKDEVTRQPLVPYLVAVGSPPAGLPPIFSSSLMTTQAHKSNKSTHQPSVKDIKSQNQSLYPLAIDYSAHPSSKKSRLHITSLPLVFCWNPLCITQLMDLITLPPCHANTSAERQLAGTLRDEVLATYQRYHSQALARKRKQENMGHRRKAPGMPGESDNRQSGNKLLLFRCSSVDVLICY